MTVIAWDGTSLCADKLLETGGYRRSCTKIFKVAHNILFAGSGEYQDVLAVRDWLIEGYKSGKQEKPKIEPNNFVGVLIDHGKVFRLEDKLIRIPIEERFMVAGCGRDFALAAMCVGKTARQAVEFASEHSMGCGMGVDELRLDDDDIPF